MGDGERSRLNVDQRMSHQIHFLVYRTTPSLPVPRPRVLREKRDVPVRIPACTVSVIEFHLMTSNSKIIEAVSHFYTLVFDVVLRSAFRSSVSIFIVPLAERQEERMIANVPMCCVEPGSRSLKVLTYRRVKWLSSAPYTKGRSLVLSIAHRFGISVCLRTVE